MKNNFNNCNKINMNLNRSNRDCTSLSDYCKNTISSLYCVESFLNDFSNYYKYVRLYKLLK